MRRGVIDIVAADFALGWARDEPSGELTHLYATVGSRIVGFARADLQRRDLNALAERGEMFAHAFIIMFERPLPVEDLERLEIRTAGEQIALTRPPETRFHRSRKCQIFVLGSPRSGTSELAGSLAEQFNLPWMGEGHAAPQFAAAATALSGDPASPYDLPRFMARQNYRALAIEAMRRAYYFMHGSASFVDKTPGVAMIKAAPFLAECFPAAHFIYLRRNGISNVLSRVVKFGGPFDEHCADWAAAMDAWAAVRPALPHWLEIEQEDMLHHPESVATRVTDYLDAAEAAEPLAVRLGAGTRERTGAGIGRTTLAETGWSAVEIELFRRICTKTMQRAGYPID